MLQINTLTRLDLGVKQENLARDLYIDMSAWISEYPNGTITVWHKRNGDETKYAVGGATFDRETNILKWTPTEYDTFYTGQGLCEIRLTENDVIKKSKDIITETARSLMLGSGETLEAGWQNLLNTISGYASDAEDAQTAAEDAQEAAEDAQAAAEDARDEAQAATVHEPTIDEDSGNWLVWDQDEGEYVDTGVHAQGPQGEPGSIDNVLATGIKMSILDDTTVYDAILDRANKVTGGTENNFAALDANGNLKDSGHKHSDYVTDVSGKADKVTGGTENNFAALDENGNLKDSGHKPSDFVNTSDVYNLVYPVGSIYMSVNSTSPSTLFGGTWAQLKDRFLLGAGDTYTAGDTGGAASQSYTPQGTVGNHTLTTTEIPSHSHGLNSHTHSIGAHNHGLNSHTHTGPSHTHTGPSHTHSVGAHSHGLNSHKHGYTDYYANTTSGSTTLTLEQIPSHSHNGYGNGTFAMMTGNTTSNIIRCDSNGATSASKTANAGGGQGHTHSVSNTSTGRTSDAATGNTANSTAFDSGSGGTGNTGSAGTGNTGGATGNTANSTAFDSGAASGNTASTGGGGAHSHSFTGTEATISTLPPYLVVYMWQRTA